MPVSLPTADDVQALHQFIQDRNEEEWQRASAAEDLPDAHFDAIRRLSHSNKLALTGMTASLLAALTQGQSANSRRLWDYLTSCGEQWQDHPAWRAEWRNPARAALLDNSTES